MLLGSEILRDLNISKTTILSTLKKENAMSFKTRDLKNKQHRLSALR